MKIKATLVVAGIVAGVAATAAPINANNLVVMRAGTGSGALTASTAAVFLDEYTTSGVLVQSISVASSGANALTVGGTGVTEGILSLSNDGSRISFGGYRRDAGLATSTGRAVGSVDLAGNVDTLTDVTGISGIFRSAVTNNGGQYWIGSASSVAYIGGAGSSQAATVVDARNSRQVNMFGGNLWASNGSTAITGKVQTYGNMPTGTTAANPIYSPGLNNAVHGFIALDLDASVAGVDTLYAMDTVASRLIKMSLVGGIWVSNGNNGSSFGSFQNLTAIKNGNDVELYATSPTQIGKIVDSTGYNGTLGASSFSAIATAATNTAYRGISSFKPVPEPGSLLALGLGAALFIRRKKA